MKILLIIILGFQRAFEVLIFQSLFECLGKAVVKGRQHQQRDLVVVMSRRVI